jgi:hypothetical protein
MIGKMWNRMGDVRKRISYLVEILKSDKRYANLNGIPARVLTEKFHRAAPSGITIHVLCKNVHAIAATNQKIENQKSGTANE